MTEAANDKLIEAAAERLQSLKSRLGEGFWTDVEAEGLRMELRLLIGRYGAWAEDRLPMHQRLRRAAEFESRYAGLLWPASIKTTD